ncbi:MAG: hypothetical protein WC788_00290 [Candidatus Paceibacterota bacterium]|jgi:hypothetical protein
MKYTRLDELWEEDEEVQKIIAINEGILKLLDVLTARQTPVRLRSYRAGVELMAAMEKDKKPVGLSDSGSFRQTEYNAGIIPILTEALEKRSCNLMQKKKIAILDMFFTNLEIGED